MPEHIVRAATLADLPVVEELAEVAVGKPQPYRQHLSPGSDRTVLVAESPAGDVVGMVSAGPPRADLPGVDARGRPMPFHDAPWTKMYALAVSSPRTGLGTSLVAQLRDRLPRRVLGIYGNVGADRSAAHAFYRARGFHLAPSVSIEGPRRQLTLMVENPGELYLVARREHLLRPPAMWEPRVAEVLMRQEVAAMRRADLRHDVGYRTWLRTVETVPAACGHDLLGPRPVTTFGHDPDRRLWCGWCAKSGLAVEVIAQHPALIEDETVCDVCDRRDPTTAPGGAVDESRLLLGIASLCSTCRSR